MAVNFFSAGRVVVHFVDLKRSCKMNMYLVLAKTGPDTAEKGRISATNEINCLSRFCQRLFESSGASEHNLYDKFAWCCAAPDSPWFVGSANTLFAAICSYRNFEKNTGFLRLHDWRHNGQCFLRRDSPSISGMFSKFILIFLSWKHSSFLHELFSKHFSSVS